MSLLIFSGGVDSTTILFDKEYGITKAVTFKYPSKHNHKEIEHSKILAELAGVELLVVDITSLFKEFSSSLLVGQGEIPKGKYSAETVPKTMVPFRNGIMLSIAAGLAKSFGLTYIFIGAHSGDYIYPDCSVSFMQSLGSAIIKGTGGEVYLEAPYIYLTKEEIIFRGLELNVPYEKTWSCYKGEDEPCNECSTCLEREKAFEKATIRYLKWKEEGEDA